MVQRWVDDDTYTLTFSGTAPDGSEFTQMEFTYVRKKAQDEISDDTDK